MGASIKMLQKQIDLEKSRIKVAKTYTEIKGQQLATENDINAATMKQIEAAGTEEERQSSINKALDESGKTGKDREILQQSLNTHVLKYNEHLGTQAKSQAKIFELTKGMREGYLNAIMSMQVNAGEFTKIIGTQDKAVGQLMDTIHDATGVDALNTNLLGGKRRRKEGETEEEFMARSKDRTEAAVTFSAEGGAKAKSQDKFSKNAEDLWVPTGKHADKVGGGQVPKELLDAAMSKGEIDAAKAKEAEKRQNPKVAGEMAENPYGTDAAKKGAKGEARLTPGNGTVLGEDLVKTSVDGVAINPETRQAQKTIGQGGDLNASAIEGGGIIGTIMVGIDDTGSLQAVFNKSKQNAVDVKVLQGATGQLPKGTPAVQ